MREVKFLIEEHDLFTLDRHAKQNGSSRAELIRSRVMSPGGRKRLSTADYHKLVVEAQRQCDLPRAQVEKLVAFVFCQLMKD
jgi:hypothetical protein